MDTGEIITLASIMITIFLAVVVLVWQMRTQSNRFSEDIREHGGRISELEREQARLEGANEILRHQSHTHESDD